MSRIGATLFSGGRGVECLLRDAIDFRFAVEYDPAIAAVGAQLGGHTITANVEDVDYSIWGALDYLHASPVCKEYSRAKTGGAEGEGDMSSAAAVVRCLEATQPRVFTLENVGAYQHGQAYRLICQWLNQNGYMWHAQMVNAADYGVPQTRRRLILRAVKDALLPGLPAPRPWVGWYAAIEDLIPGLPDSQFAPWQLARLPEEMKETFLMRGANSQQEWGDGAPRAVAPAYTVTNDTPPRAFIVSNAKTEYGNGIRSADQPMLAGDSQHGGRVRAFLAAGHFSRGMQVCDADDPAITIPATLHSKAAPPKAFLADLGNTSRDATFLEDTAPSMTVQTWHGRRPSHMPVSWLAAGRVVKMTPRALARFQSFPDWYELPSKASLACTVIGNAVPSLLMQQIVEPLL
jgi:site-specific DNA-cytosine methylase